VKERDRLVFSEVRKRDIPIVMVTSGGYQVCIGITEFMITNSLRGLTKHAPQTIDYGVTDLKSCKLRSVTSLSLPQRKNADVISNSILNLKKQGLITAPEDDPHVTSELRQQGAPLSASDIDPSETTPPESKYDRHQT
jgi:hypothetical protein